MYLVYPRTILLKFFYKILLPSIYFEFASINCQLLIYQIPLISPVQLEYFPRNIVDRYQLYAICNFAANSEILVSVSSDLSGNRFRHRLTQQDYV